MIEEWKEVLNYEGLYEVSNMGNVRNSRTGRKLSLRYRKDNHIDCMLYKNGKSIRYTVHRLVAIAFIDNPNNYPIINHIDGNGLNNNVSNLEWCTYSHNSQHNFEHIQHWLLNLIVLLLFLLFVLLQIG